MTLLSWIDVSSPMRMWNTSPRNTAPNQTLERAPRVTSPTMVAFSATKALGSICGCLPRKARIMICPLKLHLPFAELLVGEVFQELGQLIGLQLLAAFGP